MSGVSSASGGSTLGLDVVPENEPLKAGAGVAPSPSVPRRPRSSSMSSPVSSPRSPTKVRRAGNSLPGVPTKTGDLGEVLFFRRKINRVPIVCILFTGVVLKKVQSLLRSSGDRY